MVAKRLSTEVRQEQVAQATLDVIAARGLAEVSVAEVARRVGVVPSALYRHFEGKEQILDAAMEMILGRLQANVEAVLEEECSPLEHLKLLLDRHIRMVRENRGIPQLLLSSDFSFHRPDRRRRIHDGIRAYLERVADIVRRAQRIGQVAPSIDAGTVSVMFLGLIQPPAVLWHMSDGDFDVAGQTDRAWPLFLRALRSSEMAEGPQARYREHAD